MARPRSISDHDIIAAAYELLVSVGPRKLTFERLGERVGLVPAALVRRFKTKHNLLLQIDKYALERTDAEVDRALASTDSPIAALLAQFTTELGFASDIQHFCNGQEMLLMDFRNVDLYNNYKISYDHRYEQVKGFLRKAVQQGELTDIKDIAELARHLEFVLHGSGHVWAMTQEGPIEDYIKRHVLLALAPYRVRASMK